MNTTKVCINDWWPILHFWVRLQELAAVRVANTILDEVSRFNELPTTRIDPHFLPGRPQAIEMFALPVSFTGKQAQRPLADSLETLLAVETVPRPAKPKPPKPNMPFHYFVHSGRVPGSKKRERHFARIRQ